MTSTASTGPASLPGRLLVAISSAGGLIPLNSTMIAVALPAISDEFDVDVAAVSSLVIAYLAVMLVVQPFAGRLSDRYGDRRTVGVTLTGLAVVSLAALVAPSLWFLVLVRALQALFSAALNPAVQSLLVSITSADDQGRAFGIHGSVMGVGAASGPVVGGVLVQLFGWEAVFFVNVPVAAIAWLAVRAASPATSPPSRVRTSRSAGRIANEVFVSHYAAQALSTFTQYALLILTPVVLDSQGWGAGSIGLVLATLTVGMIVNGPIGGRIGDRVGSRLPSVVGLSVAAAVTVVLAVAGRSVTPALLVVGLTTFGLGLGAATPNLMSAAIGSVPRDRVGAAAGVFASARHVGSIVSTLLIARVVTDDAEGTTLVLAVGAVLLFVSVLAVARPTTTGRGQ